MKFEHPLSSATELRELYGEPTPTSRAKDVVELDEHCRDFVARSPFFVLATSSAAGACDATPRGGPPGFVRVLDARTLLIPDYPGNRRIESLSNIVENPQVQLLFFIPGLGETLRVAGRAQLFRDEALLESLGERGRPARLAIRVEAQVAYIHCAKALKRSGLWEPDSWADEVPNAARILRDHIDLEMSVDEMAEHLRVGYETKLY